VAASAAAARHARSGKLRRTRAPAGHDRRQARAPPSRGWRSAAGTAPLTPSDLDERDAQGGTALAQYASDLNVEAVELLVAAGAQSFHRLARVPGADAIEAWMRRIVNGTVVAGIAGCGPRPPR
jgi:hypothetical protein